MNTSQENKLSRYYVINSTCQKYNDTWVDDAVFAASYHQWSALIPLIEENRDAQTPETTGITTDKTAKRAVMIEKTLFMENRLQSYANTIGNSELLESVSYSASDLKKARDTVVVGICNTVRAKATANAADIEAYGVTAALITDLQDAIDAYSATLPKPKAAKSQTKTATENLRELFKKSEKYLKEHLDLDIAVYKTKSPEFYSQYNTARFSVSTGRRVIALSGKVIMADGGGPVKGVTFTITAQLNGSAKAGLVENPKTIVKKSAAKGNFRIANLPEGTYQVVVKKIGFKEQVLTITVASGETTRLKVELEKN